MKAKNKTAIIGAGAWGTASAIHLGRLGHWLDLWCYESNVAESILEFRENRIYLPEAVVPRSITPTNDLQKALKNKELVFWAVPTQFLSNIVDLSRKYVSPNAIHISLSKGIERKKIRFPIQILSGKFGDNRCGVLSGPTFANELAHQKPTVIVCASSSSDIYNRIQKIVSDETLRVYTNNDPLGVSLGGALKNIIAIATGISIGMKLGENARAGLITRGLSELVRLGKKMGAKKETLFGISGLGDMVLTCTSHKSRNFTFGFRIGQGEKPQDVLDSMTQIAEGVFSTEGALTLAKRYSVELPITSAIHQILWDNKSPEKTVIELMTRPLKKE